MVERRQILKIALAGAAEVWLDGVTHGLAAANGPGQPAPAAAPAPEKAAQPGLAFGPPSGF